MRRIWENLTLRTKVLAVVALPSASLAISFTLVMVNAQRERDAEQWVAHTMEVKAQIESTLRLTADANASVEAFLVTRRRAELQPFVDLGQQWPATIARLVEMVRDNPTQVERLKEIAALQGKNPLMSLVQYGAAHAAEPIPPELLAEHEATITRFRGILGRMHALEDDLLAQRMEAERRAAGRQQLFTLLGALFGVAGSIAAAVALAAGTARRIRTVREDADRLARGDELLPFTGDRRDEIGALGRSIRDAAGLLKAREVELQARVSELAAVNQELEAFSYSVSHDLRAPLRHITGFAALLEASADGRLEQEDVRRLRTIAQAATRMGRLIDDLLSFSRMGRHALTKRRVRLNDLVNEARKEVAEEPARAAWTIHPLPEVDADPAMMHLVFVNLFGNALKYTRPGEAASIEVGANGHRPGETVVYVRDNGVGFDMQYAHKLFGVFQRLHSSDEFEGTGIGLANVRRIVHRHGGRVWAEGAVGAGATFYFSLPQGDAAA